MRDHWEFLFPLFLGTFNLMAVTHSFCKGSIAFFELDNFWSAFFKQQLTLLQVLFHFLHPSFIHVTLLFKHLFFQGTSFLAFGPLGELSLKIYAVRFNALILVCHLCRDLKNLTNYPVRVVSLFIVARCSRCLNS